MNGANAVQVMLGAMWPSFLTLPNHIPKDQGIATNTLVAFFLFWLAHLPFLYMRPNQLRWLFIAKSVIVPYVPFNLDRMTIQLILTDPYGLPS